MPVGSATGDQSQRSQEGNPGVQGSVPPDGRVEVVADDLGRGGFIEMILHWRGGDHPPASLRPRS